MKLLQSHLKIILGVLFVLAFLILTILIYFSVFAQRKNAPPLNPIPETTPTEGAILPTPSGNIYNVLLLGQGDPSHQGYSLTDSMIVIHLDIDKKLVALVSVPRDLWITLPTKDNKTKQAKINEAYLLGGFSGVEQAVNTVTGIPIHYVVLVDFNGFVQALNLLGKIEVNVPKTFDDYYYPIAGKELDNCGMSDQQLAAINATMSGFLLEKQYTCRYEHLHFNAGKNLMDGETALKFVRSRHSDQDGNDFARSARQQTLLIGIKDKLLSLDALKNAPSFFDKLIHLVKTDLDRQTVKAVADLIMDPKEYKISQIILSPTNVLVESRGSSGQSILVPKAGPEQWSEIQQFIQQQLETD